MDEASIDRWGTLALYALAAGVIVVTLLRAHGPERPAVRGALALAAVAAIGLVAALGLVGRMPSATSGAAALAGLFAMGGVLASGRLSTGLARAAGLVVLARVLDGAAAGWNLLEPAPPWSPEVAAALLDLSPRAFVLESAGVDWMRNPAVYEVVGTDRIGPGIRTGYAGTVAGTLLLVVGCVASFMAARRGRAEAHDLSCPRDSSIAPSRRSSSPSP